MATRSLIARERKGHLNISAYDVIYCHWDGYPAGVGATLAAHYTTPDRVDALIALGDLSSLGAELGEQHPFDTHHTNPAAATWCLAYGRDRGEHGTTARRAYPSTILDVAARHDADYIYIYTVQHVWECISTSTGAICILND